MTDTEGVCRDSLTHHKADTCIVLGWGPRKSSESVGATGKALTPQGRINLLVGVHVPIAKALTKPEVCQLRYTSQVAIPWVSVLDAK